MKAEGTYTVFMLWLSYFLKKFKEGFASMLFLS